MSEMYFEPNEEDDINLENTSKEKALSIFKEVQDITDMYHIVIRNLIQFGLVVDYLSVGLSFMSSTSLKIDRTFSLLVSSKLLSSSSLGSKYISPIMMSTMRKMTTILRTQVRRKPYQFSRKLKTLQTCII